MKSHKSNTGKSRVLIIFLVFAVSFLVFTNFSSQVKANYNNNHCQSGYYWNGRACVHNGNGNGNCGQNQGNGNNGQDNGYGNQNDNCETPSPKPTPTPTSSDDCDDDNDWWNLSEYEECATPTPKATPTRTPRATPTATVKATPTSTEAPSPTPLSCSGDTHPDAAGKNCVRFQFGGAPQGGNGGGQVLGASTGPKVLGASTMAGTGTFTENLYLAIMAFGGTISAFGIKNFKKAFKKV